MFYFQSEQQRLWILRCSTLWEVFLTHILQFIVVFNNVWPAASRRFFPHCIYFLSDARPNNSVIPCGTTTQTAETPISLTSGPPPQPWRQWQPLSPSYTHLLPRLHSLSFFLFSTIFSHLDAAPSSSTPSSPLCWLAHLGKVKSIEMLALGSLRLRCFIKWGNNSYSHRCT